MKVCPKCSAQMEDRARFCTHCGTPLESSAPAPVSSTKKLPSKKLAVIGIAVAAVVVLLAIVLLNGGLKTSAMSLQHLEGTVAVSDDKGAQVTPKDNLKLYSGYGVQTQPASYAWINLDQVKRVKLDQESGIAIQKEGKQLEIAVESGSLSFNVTKPLADDETMDIRTSSMIVSVREGCGWVVSKDDQGSRVFILEGTVEAEAVSTGETVQVTAGNMAEVTVNGKGKTKITVQPFTEEHIAPFVLTELKNDADLSAAILEASGLDVLNPPDPAQRLREAYRGIIAQQTVYDHYAAAGSTYAADGINYSGDAGLSEAFLSDLDGDGTQELIMVFRFYFYRWEESKSDIDVFNSAPIQKIEVYGQSMGYPVLYDTLDVTAGLSDEYYGVNRYHLAESGSGQTICLYANYADGGVILGNFWRFSFENGSFNLLESYGEPQGSDWDWLSDGDETDLENLCSTFPDDVRRKQALLSAFVGYRGFSDGYNCIYARLIDINQDGEDELFMMTERTSDGLLSEYYAWDGTDLNRTVLASEPGDIVYGKLIDMDQDGAEELIIITDNYTGPAVAYSWKGASWERTLLCEEAFEYNGLYRDTVTGDIYLGITQWRAIGMGQTIVFYSLTDDIECSVYLEDVSLEWLLSEYDRPYEELTPAEREEFDIKMEENLKIQTERAEEFERDLARFELIEDIYPYLFGGNYEWYNEWYDQLQPTVDEVRQQLMAR